MLLLVVSPAVKSCISTWTDGVTVEGGHGCPCSEESWLLEAVHEVISDNIVLYTELCGPGNLPPGPGIDVS